MFVPSDQQPISIREFMRGGKEYVRLATLTPELPPHVRLFSTLTLIPGASIGYHVHEGETEMYYFVEGVGRVQDDDTTYDVHAGDVVVTANGHGHAVENIGDHDLIIVAVITTEA